MGAGRDRNVRRVRLFRRSGKEKTDGSESVDIVQFELGDLGVKVFVLARTPLLASMGRRVILPNDNKPIRNSAKRVKIRARVLTETCTGRRRVQRRVANTPLSGFRAAVLVGDEERVTMRTPAANSTSPPSTMEFYNNIGGDPLKPSLFELVAQEQLRDLLQPALKYVLSVRMARDERKAGHESHCANHLRSSPNNTPATCCVS